VSSIVFHLTLHFDLVFPAQRAFALLSGSGRSYLPFVATVEANGHFIRRNHEKKWRTEEKKRGCQRFSRRKRRNSHLRQPPQLIKYFYRPPVEIVILNVTFGPVFP
jgi:hypothetical protein